MTPDIIERTAIIFDDWESRFANRSGPVKSLPLSMASPPPEPVIPINHTGRKINVEGYRPNHIGTVPKNKTGRPRNPASPKASPRARKTCADTEHYWRSNGKDASGVARMRCGRCPMTRASTAEELARAAAKIAERATRVYPKLVGREKPRKPDCGHNQWKKGGIDRYGRALKRCKVPDCGRTMVGE